MQRTREVCVATALAGMSLGAASTMGQDVFDPVVVELAVQHAEEASLRRDLRRRELDVAKAKLQAGTGQPMTVMVAQFELQMAERELAITQLDREEVEATGRPVRGEITTPRVGERDFVSERLQMALKWIDRAVSMADEGARLAELRVRAGVADPQVLARATLDRERNRAAADRMRAMLALRGRYLAGEIGAEEAELTQQALLETERERVLQAERASAQPGNVTAE